MEVQRIFLSRNGFSEAKKIWLNAAYNSLPSSSLVGAFPFLGGLLGVHI